MAFEKMIKMENLGYQTDCIAGKLEGEFLVRDSYVVCRMPQNPTYYWGNLVIFKDEPQRDDFDQWISVNGTEFGESSGHVTFGWESQRVGNINRFIRHGFSLKSDSVLMLEALKPDPEPGKNLSLREICTDADWEAVLKLQILVSEGGTPSKEYVEFKNRAFQTYRRLSEAGAGAWWGAFIGETLVGDMGLYFDDQFETGRFQSVETHPEYRRIGVCSDLLHAVAGNALAKYPDAKLVICTEKDSDAERIYRKLGFKYHQRQYGVCLPHRMQISSAD